VFITAVLILGAYRTMTAVMEVSDFVVVMATMMNFDREITLLFHLLFNAVNGYVSVNKIASLLNAQTRRKALIKAKERRHRIIEELRSEFEFDHDCFTAYALEFDYNITKLPDMTDTLPSEDDSAVAVQLDAPEQDPTARLGPLTFMVEQGQLVCVKTGHNSSGKKTLLQLLARLILPTRGIIFYPENLRVRYIPTEPLLFDKTLLQNLTFGNQKTHEPEEIWAVCRQLGMGDEIIGRGSLQVGISGLKLSLSNRVFVCLARALLSSADLLFISGTLDMLTPDDAVKVISVLKVWCNERGMPCLSADSPPGVTLELKKRKTLFFVSTHEALEQQSDATLLLKPLPGAARKS